VESDTSFGISLDDLRFPLGENRIVKKGSSKEGQKYAFDIQT